jgi:hypothetical protein
VKMGFLLGCYRFIFHRSRNLAKPRNFGGGGFENPQLPSRYATVWGPEGSGRLRLPDSVTSVLEGGRLSALRTGRLYPQKYPGTNFKRLSQPRAHGIVGCHGKSPQWHHQGSIPGPSDSTDDVHKYVLPFFTCNCQVDSTLPICQIKP